MIEVPEEEKKDPADDNLQLKFHSLACYKYLSLQCYLYFPKEQDIKTGTGKKGVRRIFEGQIQFDEFEIQQINELDQYIAKSKQKIIDWWNNARKLRFLQANQFHKEKTVKSMLQHQLWRQQSLPSQLDDDILVFLKKGTFYINGKDSRMRPIIIFNVAKLNIEEVSIQNVIRGMTYLFEFILDNMLLPGQIENWVVILDLNHIGLTSLPIQALKTAMEYLSNNYRSRMFACYVVNTPNSIFVPWTIVRSFLEEVTIRKISFYKDGNPVPIFQHTNPFFIEKKYGGLAENVDEGFYWPPPEFEQIQSFLKEDDNENEIFISKEDYLILYKNNKLKRNIVCQELVCQPLGSKVVMQKLQQIDAYSVQPNIQSLANSKIMKDDQFIISSNNGHFNQQVIIFNQAMEDYLDSDWTVPDEFTTINTVLIQGNQFY